MKWACASDGGAKNGGVFVRAKQEFDALSVTPGGQSAGTMMRVEFNSRTMPPATFRRKEPSRDFSMFAGTSRRTRALAPSIVGDLNTGNQMSDRTPSGTK